VAINDWFAGAVVCANWVWTGVWAGVDCAGTFCETGFCGCTVLFTIGFALIWIINLPVTLLAVESFDGFNLQVKIASLKIIIKWYYNKQIINITNNVMIKSIIYYIAQFMFKKKKNNIIFCRGIPNNNFGYL